MHFWVSATRGGFQTGFCCPRKIGTNWFIPALVKSRLGESGISDADGTMLCFFSRKKSRKDWRISAAVMNGRMLARSEAAVYDRRMGTGKLGTSAVIDRRYSKTLLLFFVELRFHRSLDLFVERGIVLQRVFPGVATLGKLGAFVAEPGPALFDDLLLEREVEERAGR